MYKPMTEKEMMQWIKNASYHTLLQRWRFAAIGDPIFQDKIGEYYALVMAKKRNECSDPVMVSKLVGWADNEDWPVEGIDLEAPLSSLPPPSPELEKALQEIRDHFKTK